MIIFMNFRLRENETAKLIVIAIIITILNILYIFFTI